MFGFNPFADAPFAAIEDTSSGGSSVSGAFTVAGAGAAAFVGAPLASASFAIAGTGAAAFVGAPLANGAFAIAGTGAAAFVSSNSPPVVADGGFACPLGLAMFGRWGAGQSAPDTTSSGTGYARWAPYWEAMARKRQAAMEDEEILAMLGGR